MRKRGLKNTNWMSKFMGEKVEALHKLKTVNEAGNMKI